MASIKDVRSYRKPDLESDHFVVCGKVKQQIHKTKISGRSYKEPRRDFAKLAWAKQLGVKLEENLEMD